MQSLAGFDCIQLGIQFSGFAGREFGQQDFAAVCKAVEDHDEAFRFAAHGPASAVGSRQVGRGQAGIPLAADRKVPAPKLSDGFDLRHVSPSKDIIRKMAGGSPGLPA